MTSFALRYQSGDWETTWKDIRSLGPVPEGLREDIDATARMTMRGAAPQIQEMLERIVELGFVQAFGEPVRVPPEADTYERIASLQLKRGPLPSIIAAVAGEIGSVSLLGDCPSLGLFYSELSDTPAGDWYPDPLNLPGIDWLEDDWDERCFAIESGDETWAESPFEFAPDELHKANISGSTHDIAYASLDADPELMGVMHRPGITVLEYLRTSVSWGCLPGHEFSGDPLTQVIQDLRATPRF